MQTDSQCDTVITAEVPRDTCETSEAALVSLTMNIKVMLEGAYDSEIRAMSTALNDGGYLPGQKPTTFFGAKTSSGNPYYQAPWFYVGEEGKEGGSGSSYVYHPNVVDWVLVSLRKTQARDSEVCKIAGLLHRDGIIEFRRPMAMMMDPEAEFYIVVEHRNHLPVMSTTPIPVVGGEMHYDFTKTESFTGVFGIGQIRCFNGIYVMVSGNGELVADISSDVDVNVRDLTSWLEMNGANSSLFY